ncbi:OsmC family protein [Modestobacter marinus]|uniref:OsmC family protein n=1 Tax=Modestobacter marinus TaxID=477641 RepID=UPI001C9721EB|nr:OsmC family protein [Modestobacter marinus]
MTTTTPATVNGVDTTALLTTREAVRNHPELARFQFRATNSWISGTHNRSTIDGYSGAGQELDRNGGFTFDADHPPVLTGSDNGPTPVEFLLHALAACLTAGLVNIAAARGITLTSVSSTVAGDIDLLGILGLDPGVRNGYSGIRVVMTVEGDASAEELAGLVERSRRRSAVFDVLTHGTAVDVEVRTA